MANKADLLGAVVAYVIYVSSILTFTARLAGRVRLGHWFGYLVLLTALPLIYLLAAAPGHDRPPLYYVQIGLMLAWIVALFLLDYVFKLEFRHTAWMVISFVTLFFAGTGGMLGVASSAGRGFLIPAAVLFLISAVLAFVQRYATGM